MTFQRPKGTEDFFPDDFAIRKKIFENLSKVASSFSYKQVSSPAFESLDLLTKKEGEEIKQQIFTLDKRSNEEFGLRFDLTVPITRMFMENQKSLSKPVKWFAIDRMWRYEKPQKGRLREFFQLSVELFGAKSIYADAEVISVAIECLKSFGLTDKDFFLKLNSRVLLQALLLEFVPKDKLEDALRIIDKKAKITQKAFEEELTLAGIKEVDKMNSLLSKELKEIKSDNKDVQKVIDDMNKLLDLLGENKKYVKFDISTARGLAYYTGIVFEVYDKEEKYRAILGGGRYDKMVEMFGGQATPATGFGLGYTTLSILLKDKGLLPCIDTAVDYYIAAVSEKEIPFVLDLASKLRKKYIVETDLMQRNLGNQFKYANKIKAKNVIVKIPDLTSSSPITITFLALILFAYLN
jgi:histidyl-tRNA synthetase